MDNHITSTTYVPLQPPFQIIKYADDLAMQIGTMIVTIQKDGDMNGLGYEIETHSHPVVVYENKRTAPKDRELFSSQFLEGVVWSRVQVKDVSTVCLEDSVLPWIEFVEYLRVDMMRRGGVPYPAVHTFDVLRRLGAKVNPPECKDYTVSLHTYTNAEGLRVVETPFHSVVALNVGLDDDEIMYQKLKLQLRNYMSVVHRNNFLEGFSITYTTEETARLGHLVELMNADPECTDKGCRHLTSEPLHVNIVQPYPGTETK